MTIDLEGDNVFVCVLTLEQARNITDDVIKEIEDLIDQTQGEVHMERAEVAYAVIRIRK